MNAELQPPVLVKPINKTSAQAPLSTQPSARTPSASAEDRSTKPRQRRVDPLWMITGAIALMFAFFAAVTAFD